jgi:acyl-CoA synthetase (AMP-forming)/AMP-acid ligase II
MKYKIVPSEGAKEGQGELWVKSPTIHQEEIIGGVRKNTVLIRRWLLSDRRYRRVDATGEYYIKGRSKDTIISSNGENVYPDEIEFYFKDVPHVVNDVVVGMKNGDKEDVVLILELDNVSRIATSPRSEGDRGHQCQLPNEKTGQQDPGLQEEHADRQQHEGQTLCPPRCLKNGADDFMAFDEKRERRLA